MSNINEMKEKLREGKSITIQDNNLLKYAIIDPIGNSIYNDSLDNKSEDDCEIIPKKKAKWSDIIECKTCGKKFTRSARTNHCKTQYHQLHESINAKLKDLLLK